MRAIGLLLLGAVTLSGCDRQSPGAQQANEAAPATPANAAKPAGRTLADKLDRSHKGEGAPDTPFLAPDGKRVTLAAFRGKPVLVNLWATWCAPCVKEMPTLDALAERLGERVQVLAISQDFDAAKVKPFFEKAGFKRLTPYHDTEAAFSLGLGANLPTTILYDAGGKELWRVAGEADWAASEALALVEAR